MEIDSSLLRKKLKAYFGYDGFRGTQETAIKSLVSGHNTFVLMPSGGGKSLCYQLPALLMEGTAIVISPLIALMKNQVDAIRGMMEGNKGAAHFLNSSLNRSQIAAVRSDLLAGITKLLYVAPESLTKEENIRLLKSIPISFYAVDEAHCISEWGHDFRPEYRRIRPLVDEIGPAPIVALTATATPKVQNDILKTLGISDAQVFKDSFNRPNLFYEVKDKLEPEKDMIKYIKQHPGESGIVYCLSRKKVEEMARLLEINGIRALPYHAGLDAKVRAENQDRFLMEEVDVIVATIAFGMGIDKPDVRFVIHFDMPKSMESYYQETGRAGRDGHGGRCIAYYSHRDVQKLEKFMQGKPISEQEIGRHLLEETIAYAESNSCRRKVMLNYFGEDFPPQNCGCCDNCTTPKERFDGQNEMRTVLSLVSSLPEHFKLNHLAHILSGENNALIQSFRHNKLPLFGVGKTRGIQFWRMVLRQGLIHHLLDKEIESYGLIFITDKGRDYIEKPYPIPMVEDRVFSSETGKDQEDGIPPLALQGRGCDEQLLQMLKGLRKDMARKLGLPPWVIFGDPALEDMCIFYPLTGEELKCCQGVGEGKARKFGKEFLNLIRSYVEENDISRAEDFVVKSVAGKSGMKVSIIQCIDKRMEFEDIAAAKGMSMRELVKEINDIVDFGTRLNLDYYIRQHLDDDTAEEIYAYFRYQAQSDSVEEAIKVLGPEYDELDICLVRAKFLSEQAN